MKKTLMAAACLAALAAAGPAATPRFPELQPDQLTPEQKPVADAILSGPRHSLEGPFNAWLRSPELAGRLQRVGEYVRFNTSLPHALNEFAILITAQEWGAGFEWYAHEPLAIKAGLEPAVAADLQAGRRPAEMTEDEALVYDFSTQLHRQHQVSDAVYAGVVRRFGEQGAMDLIAVNGYYDLVAMTLNVAEVRSPEGSDRTLPAPPKPR